MEVKNLAEYQIRHQARGGQQEKEPEEPHGQVCHEDDLEEV